MDILEFDYIVCGGGSAGCVLANRLSANGKHHVALLEAGGKDDWIWFHVPVGYLFAIGNPRADWLYKTDAEPLLNGRCLAYPRGKVLGGSSAINAMIYMRGQAADYNSWRDMGLTNWGWDDVLPVFKHMEDNWRGGNDWHGAGGEWRVEQPRMRWKILDTFIRAAEQAGIRPTDDFNTGDNAGCGYFDVNQKSGTRWSSARGFLKPAMNRHNLHVLTNTVVDRILKEDERAPAVVVHRHGKPMQIKARAEIILAAGAIGTPAILERSGIGHAERLKALGIAPMHHSPGVGENLQDHLQLRTVFKVCNVPTMNMLYRSYINRGVMALSYALLRRGPMTMAPSQLGAFVASSDRYDRPNLQFHIQPLSLDKFGDPLHDFPAITVSVCNLRPESRGSVHIQSSDINLAPRIVANYLSANEDRLVAVDAIGWARKIMAQSALKPFEPREFLPGAHNVGFDDLVTAAGQIGTTIFHPVGTARMGTDDDPMAVVDNKLRVKGAAKIRVADASAMPLITSGNTNTPTMMLAEKAAKIILS